MVRKLFLMKLPFASDKVISREEAADRVQDRRKKGEKLVFTNGCFDLLHPGHIDLLYRASAYGDLLIVGLNSDASIKKLGKGPERPITDEASRAVLLAALEMVDRVVLFEEETPLQLIRELDPDVLVKGSDYQDAEVVGREFVEERGGRTVLLSLLEGYSSTRLIERIRASKEG